jgi:3,4-dihydroxy 2-butanone 4-phosphate synthase
MTVKKALSDLRKGRFVLIHDSLGRENEVDMAIAGEKIKPEDVARLRTDGGGLICVALSKQIARRLKLPFIQEVYKRSNMEIFKALKADDIPYDEKSAFSLTINHRKTFTGITDKDRALTIREFALLCKKPSLRKFGKKFRTPGHVHLLISAGIEKRKGHTELSTKLAKMAGLTGVMAICEMMDGKTKKALSLEKSGKYARKNNLTLIDSKQILEYVRGVR